MAVIWIEWNFWSWKTSLSAFFASNSNPNDTIILSNIKLNKYIIPNYVPFSDDEFLTLLRTANFYNDIERVLYSKFNEKTWLFDHKRWQFTKFIILFDEVWTIYNWKFKSKLEEALSDYVNQQRKNFQDIYLITADWAQTDKSLRRFAQFYLYCKPLWDFWKFEDIKVVRKIFKDSDDNIRHEKYLARDDKGDYVVKEKPMDYYFSWFYQPFTRSLYDDLHKSITDPEKYKISIALLSDMLRHKPKLLKELKTNPDLVKYIENSSVMLQVAKNIEKPKHGLALDILQAIKQEFKIVKKWFILTYNDIFKRWEK